MDYEEKEKSFYEQFWKSLKGKFSEDSWHYSSNVPYLTFSKLIRFLKKNKVEGSILDVGCGNGRNSIPCAKQGFKTYGIDISESALKIARKNAKMNKVKVDFQVGSVLDLPYPQKFFEVVMDFGCLHHLRESQWKGYKENIKKVLKRNGYYYLLCFSRNSGYIPTFTPKTKEKNFTIRNGHFNRFFTRSDVEQLFGDTFEIVTYFETKKKGSPLIFNEFYMQRKSP